MVNLSQTWWLVVLRGLVAVLFGVAAFVWPGLTTLALVIMFGVYALVDGLFAVVTGLTHIQDTPRWWVFLLEGLVGIIAGVVAVLFPAVATLALLALVAAWAIITGVLEIAAAIRLRREIANEWFLALGGVLSIGLGLLLIFRPLAGGLALIWTIGAYALIFGVLLISLGFRLRNWTAPVQTTRGRKTKAKVKAKTKTVRTA